MKPIYQIREYGSFVCEKEVNGCISLPEPIFSQLEEFVLTNRGKDTEAIELMGVSARKGVGKIITAKNYVGVITMKDGTTIEILPKIYSKLGGEQSEICAKKLLIEMLKTLRDSPYKSFQASNVNIAKMNIFEIFIRMFIDDVFFIVKRGLKQSYERVEENASLYKGKLQFSKQIKYNLAHKERNYLEYDEFTVNRAENRILKATLQYLYQHSSSLKNRNDIKILLNAFTEIEASIDHKSDFAQCVSDRNMKDYERVLLWSKVFLLGKSFTSFVGSEVAVALLFPMEKLFESFVAAKLKKEFIPKGYSVSLQDKKYHLFNEPSRRFAMRPDVVLTCKSNGDVFVIDTKWKMLSEKQVNYGISQADMYQMYAYQKKYMAKTVILLYPNVEKLGEKDIQFLSSDGVIVKVRFVDVFSMDNFLKDFDKEIS